MLFPRTDWTRNGANVKTLGDVQMRTRGFFPDACVLAPLPCLTQPEDTATTHVIRALALRHPTIPQAKVPPDPIGAVVELFEKVHWQVGPNGGWRTDVLVDDGGDPTILEVKRWGSAATTPGQVDKQLSNPNPLPGEEYGYLQKFDNDVGLTVFRNDELNIDDWLQAYLDNGLGISCVWADPDEFNHPGNIYYAPILEAPPNVQARCAIETLGKIVVITGLPKLAVELVEALVKLWKRPVITPPVQETDEECDAHYDVIAPQDATQPTTMSFSFGDGQTAPLTNLPQGSGTTTVSFDHRFPCGTGTYVQTARIVESGATSAPAITAVAPAAEPPGGIFFETPANIQVGTSTEAWDICVRVDPLSQRTVLMDYGDGFAESRVVAWAPPGPECGALAGYVATTFVRSLDAAGPVQQFTQTAGVVETGATATAVTLALLGCGQARVPCGAQFYLAPDRGPSGTAFLAAGVSANTTVNGRADLVRSAAGGACGTGTTVVGTAVGEDPNAVVGAGSIVAAPGSYRIWVQGAPLFCTTFTVM